MSIPNTPEIPPNPTTKQLAEIVAQGFQEIFYQLSGFLNSKNILEAGGWVVGPTELQSKDKTVGMSTAKTGGDDIRFFAGDVITGSPKFKVTESGIATLISAILASVESGERVVIDSTGFHAYDSSGIERITIGTTPALGARSISFADETGTDQGFVTCGTETVDSASRTGLYIVGNATQLGYILLEDTGDLRMQTGNGPTDSGFRAIVGNRPQIHDTGAWYDIATTAELPTGASGTVYVSSSMGGAIDTAITFSNGIRTS